MREWSIAGIQTGFRRTSMLGILLVLCLTALVSGVDAQAAPSQDQTGVNAVMQDVALPAMTILLMGVDARPGEAIDAGVRPDALAVLRLDPATGSCKMLAIPRDSRVELPGYGLTKINHALAVGGIPYQELVVQNFLGISIDKYALIDFGGITELVNAVGGVPIQITESFAIAGQQFD